MRCVNLDWLEISAEESNSRYPCDAEYFRSRGFIVHERDYGTRVWGEVFTIEDESGHDWIEVRRKPPSGASEFKGLNEYSCRLRVVNAQLYVKDCVQRFRDFLATNDYIFKRIFRIDIAYDFEYFDSKDLPARFARRYLECKYRKINQCKMNGYANDTWTAFEWESLSWGSPHSMVSTKLYNKTKEIETVSKHKVYIPYAWFVCGLIDDPINLTKVDSDGKLYKPEIWRLEFSMRSQAERWLVIEDQSGKRVKKKAIPHTLDMFDAPDKIWQRFQDLAFHYFRFKKYVPDKRKDLCPDKVLFHWDKDHEWKQLDMALRPARPDNDLQILVRHLKRYQIRTTNMKVRDAIDVILDALRMVDLRRFTPRQLFVETNALRQTLSIRLKHPEVDVMETYETIKQMLFDDKIF
ncbi:MAG: hypothetical protein IKA00_00570 [Prevotella sp.]|nr:hypothetical protein [Prevotella sp.]